MENTVNIEIDGRSISLETGKWAKQANASVTVKCGGSLVLVTVVAGKEPKRGIDFFPLVVDVEERMYAAGKIPGGFIKREGRPSEGAILTARMIDRPVRPLFPDEFVTDVQIIATILSVDQINPPDVLAMIGASAVLTISNIPFNGPFAAIRVGIIDDKYVFNPTFEELEKSKINLIVTGTKEAITMVEGESLEVSENVIHDAIMEAEKKIQELIQLQEELQDKAGVEKKTFEPLIMDEALKKEVLAKITEPMKKALRNTSRSDRQETIRKMGNDLKQEYEDIYEEKGWEIKKTVYDLEKKEVRRLILEEGYRIDGRSVDEIRNITCESGLLPRTHGSGLFTRGQTQVLSALTLGALGELQRLDGLGVEDGKRFLHHYNFPPFSTGETAFMRGPKRREIGHGALVERALATIIPDEEEFPYTIRIVSEILESNGSSSMASVCASTIALMDAGVPVKEPVAGIAIGLVKQDEKEVVLTDIQGLEDFFGDMDFKVAGTKNGITALQMDIKTSGISFETINAGLNRAKEARLFILEKIAEILPQPREELSPFAPRVVNIKIPTDKIREVIGPGGKMIRSIVDETGASIDIEDDGQILITAKDNDAAKKAQEIIEKITAPPKPVNVGESYTGTVVSITPFGAFVEVVPGRDGLVHISKLADHRVNKVEDVVKVGQKLDVDVIGVDNQGRVSLATSGLKSSKTGDNSRRKRS